jgi:hypothetical protein
VTIMPPGSESNNATPDDEIVVTWQDCNCEWTTKTCEELHVRYTILPRRLLDGSVGDA